MAGWYTPPEMNAKCNHDILAFGINNPVARVTVEGTCFIMTRVPRMPDKCAP